ncbi:MAG: hypothetical protein ACRCZF_20905, partial [Gemmataceae bacterium]
MQHDSIAAAPVVYGSRSILLVRNNRIYEAYRLEDDLALLYVADATAEWPVTKLLNWTPENERGLKRIVLLQLLVLPLLGMAGLIGGGMYLFNELASAKEKKEVDFTQLYAAGVGVLICVALACWLMYVRKLRQARAYVRELRSHAALTVPERFEAATQQPHLLFLAETLQFVRLQRDPQTNTWQIAVTDQKQGAWTFALPREQDRKAARAALGDLIQEFETPTHKSRKIAPQAVVMEDLAPLPIAQPMIAPAAAAGTEEPAEVIAPDAELRGRKSSKRVWFFVLQKPSRTMPDTQGYRVVATPTALCFLNTGFRYRHFDFESFQKVTYAIIVALALMAIGFWFFWNQYLTNNPSLEKTYGMLHYGGILTAIIVGA